MATLVELQMQRASFRGVEFLWDNLSTSSGRKNVTFEYANSDKRNIQDLGLLKKTYTIQAVIYNRRSIIDLVRQRDYYTWRDAFISALEQKGPGALIHPTFGRKTVSIVDAYLANESQIDVGICRFTVTFAEVDDQILPTSSSNNKDIIDRISDSAIGRVARTIQNGMRVARIAAANVRDVIGNIRQISNTFNGIRGRFGSGARISDIALDTIRAVDDNAPSLAVNPTDLANATGTLLIQSNEYSDDPDDKFEISTELYDFGDEDFEQFQESILTPTAQSEIAVNNRLVLDQAVQTGGLINSYRNIPLMDLSDDEKIRVATEVVEAQFDKVNQFDKLEPALRDDLARLKVETTRFINTAAESAFRVEDVNVETTSMELLAYRYYGSADNVARLIELNPDQDPLFVSGITKVLVAR